MYQELPISLVHKLYYFFEPDYLAFGYEKPWDWLHVTIQI